MHLVLSPRYSLTQVSLPMATPAASSTIRDGRGPPLTFWEGLDFFSLLLLFFFFYLLSPPSLRPSVRPSCYPCPFAPPTEDDPFSSTTSTRLSTLADARLRELACVCVCLELPLFPHPPSFVAQCHRNFAGNLQILKYHLTRSFLSFSFIMKLRFFLLLR